VLEKDLPYVNLEDLRAFPGAVRSRLVLGNYHHVADEAPLVFASHFSLGRAAPGFRQGDQIWAVDGATVPLVLRKAGSEYRLVGECYLWAALDLDRSIQARRKVAGCRATRGLQKKHD
jgi:hypothetical protein